MTAQELAEACLKLAELTYLKGDRTLMHPHVLHIVSAEKHEMVFFEQFGDAHSKQGCRLLCMMASRKAELIAFCSEGWMLKGREEDLERERHAVMGDLSLHPDRIEVLTVEVAGPASAWSITARIDRSGEQVKLHLLHSEQPSPSWRNRYLSDLPWKERNRA